MKIAVAFLILLIVGCAVLASHQHKPFPLLIDEAEASMIVCNPVLVPNVPRMKRINRT